MIVSTFTDNHFLIYVLKRGCSKKNITFAKNNTF